MIPFDFEKAYQQSYDNTIEYFVQALEKNEPYETDGFDNLQTLKLVDDAYRLAGLPAEHKEETWLQLLLDTHTPFPYMFVLSDGNFIAYRMKGEYHFLKIFHVLPKLKDGAFSVGAIQTVGP